MYTHCELINPAMSVYIVCKQPIHHQPVVHTLACSKDFHICVLRALFHTHVFFKFKSSCNRSESSHTYICKHVYVHACTLAYDNILILCNFSVNWSVAMQLETHTWLMWGKVQVKLQSTGKDNGCP